MGPSLYSMFVFGVRVIGLLCRRYIYFSAFYLAASSVLSLSCPCLFLGGPTCIGWKYFATVLVCVLCGGRHASLPVTWGVPAASKILLLLHMSTPLPVHRMRMHSDLYGGSIAEGFRLSTT